MADLNPALIALIGVLAGGFLSNFLGEDYRRYRDSKAVAAAIAGELDSHGSAIGELRPALLGILGEIQKGEKLALPEFPQPPSPVFEALVDKIGLLGPDLARDVAFVYEQIRAFRIAMHLLSKHHLEMPEKWRAAMVQSATDRINCAVDKGTDLVKALQAHAKTTYPQYSPIPIWTAAGTVLVVAFVAWTTIRASASEPATQWQCATTISKGTFQTACK